MPLGQKKKILYIITKSNFGGAQRYVYELATRLPQEKFEVAVACGGNGELVRKLRDANIRTIEIRNFQREIGFTKELHAFRELWSLIKQEQPDVLHLNSSKAVALGAFVARLTGAPRIISTVHGWAFLERRNILWRTFVWITSWFGALCSHAIILVSEYDRGHAHMPFVSQKYQIIHTAVPHIDFMRREEARSTLLPEDVAQHTEDIWLVSIAELTPNKNLRTAVDAVDIYNKRASQKVFYSVIGSGELGDELQRQINTQGLSGQVKLLGSLESARMYLKAFDIFLLPSYKEGLPYALLEAGAAGLACIGSNVGGIPEVIKNRENGLLIDPDSPESIVTALETLTENNNRNKYGEALRKTVEEEYAFTDMCKQTIGVYEH